MFVKICGLTTEASVTTAVEAGADAIGFVFADSPRQIDCATAQRLRQLIPDGSGSSACFSTRTSRRFVPPSLAD
ncbi:hypothetical protein [Exiguobacterium mexicanum]|uniref:hypothetical protein n=1 Tax=Exiguobacterium mexicanum TaxID=340146 RepID=UPI0037C0FAE8